MPRLPDSPAGHTARADVRVILLERAGCHLCEDARSVLDAVCGPRGVRWLAVDVDGSDDLVAAYGELVPVVLVDGVPRGQWRFEADRIAAAIDAERS